MFLFFSLSFLLQNVLSDPFNLWGRRDVRLDVWLGVLQLLVSDRREVRGNESVDFAVPHDCTGLDLHPS